MNTRTATKATIKRAARKAQSALRQQDRDTRQQLTVLYVQASTELERIIYAHSDYSEILRLEALRDLRQRIEEQLDRLGRARDALLDSSMSAAAALGASVTSVVGTPAVTVQATAQRTVQFVRSFIAADGLQLSDRLWRLDQHAREIIIQAVESAVVQGASASRAAQELLGQGQPVPADIAAKMEAANAVKVARDASRQLLTLEGQRSPHENALRVFRTEINRAYGEAYMAGAESVPGFVGYRFLLSPAHPRPDICDMHARANLYGLGPGVYPSRERCPWPAHPNTLSFVEIVFDDEVSDEDRAGKEDRLSWLKQQPPAVQESVLGSRKKRQALERDILREGEIATPWKVLKKRYEKRGIELEG